MFQFLRGIALIATIMLNCGAAFAQTPPTETEVFNLRIRCQEMADKKAKNYILWNPEEIIVSAWSSKYDAKSNRCYIKLYAHDFVRKLSMDREVRQVFDAATDDLIAIAETKNGNKYGEVFDSEHRKTTNENLGWNDAIDYMDEIMADKRN